MARVTSARQIAIQAARNARNSTTGAAGAAADSATPPPPPPAHQPPITRSKAINNSIEALNRRLIQDQIDHNNAQAQITLQQAQQTL
jgi:hypothetical protein